MKYITQLRMTIYICDLARIQPAQSLMYLVSELTYPFAAA